MNTPLNENEEKKILEVISLEKGDEKSGSITEKLLKIFEKMEVVLFIDQFDTPFFSTVIKGVRTNFPIETKNFRHFAQKVSFEGGLGLLGREVVQKVEDLFAAKAIHEGEVINLANRVASYEESFWYDLGKGQAIRVDKNGWMQEDAPMIFRSYQHQLPQVSPQTIGGDAHLLLRFITLKNKENECLLLTWTITCLIADIPHAVLVLHGEKGAGKSTTMRFIQSLVDPSKAGILSFPRISELVQQMQHHHCIFYDNLRKLSDAEADALCRAVTGGGNTKRKLYTDDEDVVYNFRRCIGLNGISNMVETPDLTDRSLTIELSRIESSARRTEQEIDEEFELARSTMLGGFFDILSKAIELYPTVKLKNYPRMADFARWGYAISEALGYGGEFFLKAYNNNIQKQNEEVVEANPVAFAVRKLMETEEGWRGTPAELLDQFTKHWSDWKLDEKACPKNPSVLGKFLKEVKSNLEEIGIHFEYSKDDRGRHYTFAKTSVFPVLPSGEPESVEDTRDSKDSSLPALSDDQIRSALWPKAEIITEPLKK
jgi:hypothetical protein